MAIVDGHIHLLASTQGLFQDLVSAHAVNNHGHVVFSAVLASGISGLFVGPNPETDIVIKQGDQLFGTRIVEGPVLSNRGFNDAGQIAFYARLEDGTEGIYRADPTTSPATEILTNPGTMSNQADAEP